MATKAQKKTTKPFAAKTSLKKTISILVNALLHARKRTAYTALKEDYKIYFEIEIVTGLRHTHTHTQKTTTRTSDENA